MPGKDGLTHVDETGSVRMVDVGGKPHERRRARARASIRMAPETASRIRELPKGDGWTRLAISPVVRLRG